MTSALMMTKFPDLSSHTGDDTAPEKISIFNTSGVNLPFNISVAAEIMSILESGENMQFSHVELVYTNEEEIKEINRKYLQRDYITDIISFRYDDDPENENRSIEGTLYCCAPRIIEQSREFETSPGEEFRRVFIHGLLHLGGYNDQTPDEKSEMTRLEDHYLEMVSS